MRIEQSHERYALRHCEHVLTGEYIPCLRRSSPSQGKRLRVRLKLLMIGAIASLYRSKRSVSLIEGGAGTLYATSGQKGTSTSKRQRLSV